MVAQFNAGRLRQETVERLVLDGSSALSGFGTISLFQLSSLTHDNVDCYPSLVRLIPPEFLQRRLLSIGPTSSPSLDMLRTTLKSAFLFATGNFTKVTNTRHTINRPHPSRICYFVTQQSIEPSHWRTMHRKGKFNCFISVEYLMEWQCTVSYYVVFRYLTVFHTLNGRCFLWIMALHFLMELPLSGSLLFDSYYE